MAGSITIDARTQDLQINLYLAAPKKSVKFNAEPLFKALREIANGKVTSRLYRNDGKFLIADANALAVALVKSRKSVLGLCVEFGLEEELELVPCGVRDEMVTISLRRIHGENCDRAKWPLDVDWEVKVDQGSKLVFSVPRDDMVCPLADSKLPVTCGFRMRLVYDSTSRAETTEFNKWVSNSNEMIVKAYRRLFG
ncbi:MAG TPA: hypothetical protein VD907_01820 [Verrucomicrobiae bacterium]|nr:hypothetical protein [Verrucomicrobiae bacterium]